MRIVCLLIVLVVSGCVPMEARLSPEQAMQVEAKLQELLAKGVIDLEENGSEGVERAQAAFELAKALSPEDPRVLDGLGAVAFRRGDYLKAKGLFQQAIIVDENYDPAYMHLAAVAEKNGDLLAAYQLLQKAIEKNPLNYRAHNNLGAFLLKYNSKEESSVRHAKNELLKASQLLENSRVEGLAIEKNLSNKKSNLSEKGKAQ